MAKITKDQYQAAYKMAVDIYEKKNNLSDKEAAKILHEEKGINISSAEIFIKVYKNLRDGLVFKRTLSKESTEYFLNGIYKDHGVDALKAALKAINLHIDYWEEKYGSQKLYMRTIIKRFGEMIN